MKEPIFVRSLTDTERTALRAGLRASDAIRAFEAEGVACLGAKSSRPLSAKPELNEKKTEQLRELLHRSPRDFGKGRSTWTLELAAEVCFEQQLTEKRVSDETIRQALLRLGVKWQRARDWITSPDRQYLRKKSGVIA